MSQFYSDPSREDDEHALPDCEVFELTSAEAAELADEDTVEEARRAVGGPCMSSRDRERLLDAIRAITGDQGGWYYQFCFPGCLPDSEPMGPFASRDEAIAAAREE